MEESAAHLDCALFPFTLKRLNNTTELLGNDLVMSEFRAGTHTCFPCVALRNQLGDTFRSWFLISWEAGALGIDNRRQRTGESYPKSKSPADEGSRLGGRRIEVYQELCQLNFSVITKGRVVVQIHIGTERKTT